MKKINTLFIAVALAITGCSTSSDLRTESVSKTLHSNKDAKTIASCVIDGFEGVFKIAGVNGKPTSNGYTVSVSAGVALGKDTAVVVDIENTDKGSTTSFYSKMLFGEVKIAKIVSECQN